MQTNIVMTLIQGNKKASKTLTYINPNASNERLLALARALNALTVNTITLVTKETKGEVL